jgi:hypothetical protein
MVKSCPVSEDEWLSTLGSLLRQELVDDMEIVATVDSESTLVLTFRKRVRGITVSIESSARSSRGRACC